MEIGNFLSSLLVYFKKRFELIFWIFSLLWLGFSNPSEAHFSLCPIKNLGFTWCLGCGLGHSISAIFRLQIEQSFQYHWFGIPALLIILHRIYQLVKNKI